MKIIRRPRPKRFPRPWRYPKPKTKPGKVFEFFGGFPYLYVGHLNATETPYKLTYKRGGVRIEITGKPHKPGARMVRKPMRKRHGLEINIVEDLAARHKEKNPELFEQLKTLIEKFRRKGRRTYLHCPQDPSRACKDITVCLARCSHRCGELSAENIMGENDNKAEFFQDLLKIQRLVNIIYGTVRQENHFKDGD